MDPRDTLRSLSLFVTERCNLDCGYCYFPHKGNNDIDFETGQDAVDFLIRHSGQAAELHLSFWGGEPLLCFPLIQKLVEYGNRAARTLSKTLHCSIPTNCTLLTREILEFVKTHGIFLSLSIDGAAASQSARRLPDGASSYAAVRGNLQLIGQAGLNAHLGVRKTVTPETASDLHADARFFLDHDLRRISFSPTMEDPWPDEQLAVFEAQQLSLADEWLDSLGTDRAFSIRVWDEMLLQKRETGTTGLPCSAGVSTLAVDVHGNLYPCHRFVAYDSPWREQRLGDVWQGVTNGPLSELYRSIGPEALSRRTDGCTTCRQASNCRLFCPATNYRLTGHPLRNAPELCRFQMILERVMDRIRACGARQQALQSYLEKSPLHSLRHRPGRWESDRILDKALAHLAELRRLKARS